MERDFLIRLFEAAVASASAERCLPPHLPAPPAGRTLVLAFGKGAAAMARVVEAHWEGPLEGMAVTRYGHAVPCERIEVVEAGHPVPDEAGRDAAARALARARELGADDLLLCLVSGGGSALLAVPAPGVTLEAKQALTRDLLRSGASIAEINGVRKHLSAVKGGRLAAAAFPAHTVALAVSDVPGDDPSVIASGPTVGDATTLGHARRVLERYGLAVPAALSDPANETPEPDDPRLARSDITIVARPGDALAAAAEAVRAEGRRPVILGDAIEGEAREVAREHARLALEAEAGTVLISGGETTVAVRGPGRGGPNAEYLLALMLALDGAPGVSAIACDTDGLDGTEDNAGAVIGPDSPVRARGLGIDPAACLAENDSYGLFQALGDLVVTGPTRTNVNDFRAILVGGGG